MLKSNPRNSCSPAVRRHEGQRPVAVAAEWPSYNRTLISERFAPLNEITTATGSKSAPPEGGRI